MKTASNWNKMNHEENVDSEKNQDLDHAALAKMIEGSQSSVIPPVQTQPPAVAPVAPVPPPPHVSVAAPHVPFAGLHAMVRPPTATASPVKIAPAMPRKPFQKRI